MGVLPTLTVDGVKSVATTYVFLHQVVSVDTVRLIPGATSERVVVIVNVFTDHVVSVSPVRLIPIAQLRRLVVTKNANLAPIAWGLLVPPTLIAGLVIGSIAFIIMISLCISCACCRRQRALRHGRVIEGITIQSNQPSARVIQSYPHYPPAQYEQHQRTTNPPPYNPETMAASEQPPPSYTEATQGVSGRVAVPSAPPL
ncbi:hypothetical protein ACROYT_G018109 [Oculina patagonica]